MNGFVVGIPGQFFAAQLHGDVGQVGNGNGAVSVFDRGDGLGAGIDGIDEVDHVFLAHGEVAFVVLDLVPEDFFRVGFEASAVGVDPFSVFAFEGDAAALFCADFHDEAVFVAAFEIVTGGGVVEFGAGGEVAGEVGEFHGAGFFVPHGPLGDVEVVGSPVGQLAAGVVENPPPVYVEACVAVVGFGGRAEPHVVIESLGDRYLVFLGPAVAVVGVPAGEADGDGVHFSNETGTDHFEAATEMDHGALLAPGLEGDPGIADGVGHLAAFFDREGEGFLTVDVLFGFGRRDDLQGMPVVGRGDLNRIDVFAGEEFPEVAVHVAAFVGAGFFVLGVGFVNNVAGHFAPAGTAFPEPVPFFAYVVDGNHLNPGIREEVAHPVDAVVADADTSYGEAFGGSRAGAFAQDRSGDDGRCGDREGGLLEKGAAGNGMVFHAGKVGREGEEASGNPEISRHLMEAGFLWKGWPGTLPSV